MSLAYKTILLLLICIISSAAADSAANYDKWFSKDKYQHFSVSAFYAMGTSIVLAKHFDRSRGESLGIAVGFTISIGLGKEIADKYKPSETSSFKDLLWDILGVAAGISLASLII